MITKSELIETIAQRYPDMTKKQIEYIINAIFLTIRDSLKEGNTVEIRGFGSFKVRVKDAKSGRNPKTGTRVLVPEKKVPAFKPGKEIKEALLAIEVKDK